MIVVHIFKKVFWSICPGCKSRNLTFLPTFIDHMNNPVWVCKNCKKEWL